MRWKVLVSATYLQPAIDRYRPWLAEHDIEVVLPPVNERMEEADLLPGSATLTARSVATTVSPPAFWTPRRASR